LGEIKRQSREPEGLDYVKVSLGLVFVFGAFVFGTLPRRARWWSPSA